MRLALVLLVLVLIVILSVLIVLIFVLIVLVLVLVLILVLIVVLVLHNKHSFFVIWKLRAYYALPHSFLCDVNCLIATPNGQATHTKAKRMLW